MTEPTHSGARPGPQALSAAISAVLTVAGRYRRGAGTGPGRHRTRRGHRHRDQARRAAAGRLRVHQRLRQPATSRCAACRRSTTSRSTSRACRWRSASRAARPSCSAASRAPASSSAACLPSALYLDEQPITQSGRSPDPRFIDIERIEALRGPQGTLYGSSSQSGTLRVITNKPDPSGFDAWAEAQVTDVQDGGTGLRRQRDGQHPARLGPRRRCASSASPPRMRAISTTCSRHSQGGTFDNADQVEEDVNSIETTGARAALRFDITENLDATVGLLYQDLTANGHSDMSEGVGDLSRSGSRTRASTTSGTRRR